MASQEYSTVEGWQCGRCKVVVLPAPGVSVDGCPECGTRQLALVYVAKPRGAGQTADAEVGRSHLDDVPALADDSRRIAKPPVQLLESLQRTQAGCIVLNVGDRRRKRHVTLA